jgi:hypothetical protein
VVTCALGGSDLAARKSERLEDPLVAECRLLVELFFFARAARLLALLARSPIVGHSWSSHSFKRKKLAYPPSFDKSKGSVLHGFPRCQCDLDAMRRRRINILNKMIEFHPVARAAN